MKNITGMGGWVTWVGIAIEIVSIVLQQAFNIDLSEVLQPLGVSVIGLGLGRKMEK